MRAVENIWHYAEHSRWIEVSIGLHQNFLTILISNSIEGPVSLRSEKHNRRNHGFGIQNLRECVERNSGEVKIWMEEDKFVLNIVVSAF